MSDPPFTGVPLQAPDVVRGASGLVGNDETVDTDADADVFVDAADEATLGATANPATKDTEPSATAANLIAFVRPG